jgi:homoprotocatechuate degradation regulator HpaR
MKTDFESLPILLQKAREALVMGQRKVLAPFDLTEQQWRVIRTIFLNGDINAQTLASQSAILGPSLSRILSRLDEDGILNRKVSSGDQRELEISLTAKGKRLHAKVQPQLENLYHVQSQHWDTDKFGQVVSLLDDLAAIGQE